MNLEQAKRASKKGAYTAFLLAGLGTILVTYLIFVANSSNPTPHSKLYGEPSYYLSCLFYIFLGFKVLKFSRVAAGLLLFFIIGSLIIGMSNSFGPIAVSFFLCLAYFFGNALRGTFAYHKIQRKEDPHYRRTPKWQYFIGIPASLLLLLGISSIVLPTFGILPSTMVEAGANLHSKVKETLRQNDILMKDEKIDFFYSEGLFSILEGGNILTNQRIISYQTLGEELSIYALNLEDVTEYALIDKGDFLNDTVIEVYSKDENSVTLFLSTENDGDEQFIEALSNRIPPSKPKEKPDQITVTR